MNYYFDENLRQLIKSCECERESVREIKVNYYLIKFYGSLLKVAAMNVKVPEKLK